MGSYAALRDRLPSLYRPEDGAPRELFARYLRAVAAMLDALDQEASEVMQAHWFGTADRALFSPWLRRTLELQELPPPKADDPVVATFPHINDLARIGSLLALLPWREPVAQRETVEAYRLRLRRMVALYRNGLGTVPALRAMIEAQLPPLDPLAAPGLRDRPFTLEEFTPLIGAVRPVPARGAPGDLIGPLMRWTLINEGVEAAPATVCVQGVLPVPERVDPTTRPVIERYLGGGRGGHLGIAYDGELAPDQTLRLRPAFSSWIGQDDGLRRGQSRPTAATSADPAASGPWQAVAGAPAATVNAIAQTRDRTLWLAVGEEEAGALWRYDGESWTEALSGLPAATALAPDGDDLLVGTARGLLRLLLHPPDGSSEPVPVPDPAALDGPAIHALRRAADGVWWVASERGLARLGAGDALEPFVLGADAATTTPVHTVYEDASGTLFLGTALGLFSYQPALGHWYWYQGRERSDDIPDWQPFRPEASGAARGFPADADVFLPPVRCVRRGPDASLWLGTDRGIARYRARSVDGLTYTTLLEAFPDLVGGRVFAIEEDERRNLWFATEQGLFRYDGRDWWQVQGGVPVRLALGEIDPAAVTHWRFHRPSGAWQLFDRRDGWTAFAGAARATAAAPVRAIVWTDDVVADLGAWDGTSFTADPAAAPAALRMRYKPSEDRIVAGGLPAVPRLPPGASVWRYLALEPEVVPEPKTPPAWTIEGRLLPPPPEAAAPEEGRHGAAPQPALSPFDDAVFAFNPAARLWFGVHERRPLTVLGRLATVAGGEGLDQAVLDRVWRGLEQARPAGVRAALGVGEEIVRGG